MLRELKLKAVYRTETDSLLDDFYIPTLSQSVRYDRAVGFFSTAMLSFAAQGVAAFAQNGGRMRLIFGGEIEGSELAAIEDGYRRRAVSEQFGEQYAHIIDNIADTLAYRRLEALAWLVATGILEIRVALKPKGMYHEKVGILYDEFEDRVVFQGSANETAYALLPDFNFESINVFQSWRPEHEEYAVPYVEGFERLWNNKSPGTLVLGFPDAAHARLIKIGEKVKPIKPELEAEIARRLRMRDAAKSPSSSSPLLPTDRDGLPFELRAHQRASLNAWKARGFRGVLAMATGSGKTITALYGVVKLYEAFKRLFVLVTVPYQALADQWIEEMKQFNIFGIPCYDGHQRWESDLARECSLYESGDSSFVAVVVVHRTFVSQQFQQQIGSIDGQNLFLISDECHYFGSAALYGKLPSQSLMRLGLSATPDHYFDEQRTRRVQDAFGEVAFTYDLKDALKDEVLTRYKYFVHLVDLTDDERENYLELSAKISRLAAGMAYSNIEESSDTALSALLFRRARLLANAENKIKALEALLRSSAPESFSLFYCGDGSQEDPTGDDLRQLDQVSMFLTAHDWRVAQFTAQETSAERQYTLDRFRAGALDALVAIKCLDEGIDVPACRTAYILASSRNPKQFIQRRGRILRRSAGKDFAVIHDFIPLLPDIIGDETPARSLVVAELKRVAEFARLADNPGDVVSVLRPLLSKYDLGHHLPL